MGCKFWLMFLLLALAMVAESTVFDEASWDLDHFGNDDINSCIGGHCNVEDGTETLMDSEITRRQLAQGKRYISYGALKANSIPCNRRGQSYYNCQSRRKANPYNRGCSVITHCYRFTS
ncbi:protein RALF-like 19 [Durio zibethinus]|uniref:Protein RALF-like 19 n=1 Tax=Durio zibethinus TaxID=66656 RepID=A0A6P5X944_DURZI|nr:protein RALF-like 19 [Durio zibethinus]